MINLKVTCMKSLKVLFCILTLSVTSCHKVFLEERPDKSQVVPLTLEDVQYILNNTILNESSRLLATIGADEYYYTEAEWRNLGNPTYRNGYLWADEVFDGNESTDWNYAYQKILYCNIALEKLEDIEYSQSNRIAYDRAKGTALFYRSYAFYELLQLFALPFIPGSGNDHLGVVLKLNSDITHNPGRSSVRECYGQIIKDLELAATLLPEKVPTKVNPSRYAAMALLSRCFLHMGDYSEAIGLTTTLMANFDLIDYTSYVKVGTLSFPTNVNDNPEVIYSALKRFAVTQLNYSLSDKLLASFSDDDHRKRLFFRLNREKMVFCGSYLGSTSSFAGLAIDEIYLIAIECYLHTGDLEKAKQLLAEFGSKRYDDTHVHRDEDLFDIVFEERQKQLLLRGLRWEDLRRLNFVFDRNVSIMRPAVEGNELILDPKSSRYIWPIPDSAIELGGITQNVR